VKGKNIIWMSLVALLLVPMFMTNVGISSPPTKMYVDPSPVKDPAMGIGSVFTVSVEVLDVTDLYGWQFKMLFNSSLIKATEIAIGPFLATAPDNYGVQTMALKKDNVAGYVLASQVLKPKTGVGYPPHGASGGGELATVTFQVAAVGVTLLDLTLTKLNTMVAGNNLPIEHIAEDGVFDNRLTNLLPFAIFTVTPPIGIEGDTFTFDASASRDDGWLTSYFWDFGDGTSANSKTLQKTFRSGTEGTYHVTLTVTDNDGASTSAQYDLTILGWIHAGDHPDLIRTLIWPEHPVFKEAEDGEHETLWAKVGNPTDNSYQVYVNFTIFKHDAGTRLGSICTAVQTILPHEIKDMQADFFLGDQRWATTTGPYDWPYWVKKYWAIGQCFYLDETTGQWKAGIFPGANQFKVHPVIHDRAIIAMSSNYNTTNPAPQGSTVVVDVTVENQGEQIEHDINLTAYGTYGIGQLETKFTTLAIGENKTFTFNWDTTGFAPGIYVIVAIMESHPYERLVDTADNRMYVVVSVV